MTNVFADAIDEVDIFVEDSAIFVELDDSHVILTHPIIYCSV